MCSLKENEMQESKRRFSLIRLIESSSQIISKVIQYLSIKYISIKTNHSLSIVAYHPHNLHRNIETRCITFKFCFCLKKQKPENSHKRVVTKTNSPRNNFRTIQCVEKHV